MMIRIRVLADDDCQRIHEATLTVLEQAGVGFPDCPEAQALFLRHGCVVNGDRVFVPPAALTEALARVPDRNGLAPFFPFLGYAAPVSARQGDVSFGLVGNAFSIHDYRAGAARDCVESDVDDKLLVVDSLPNFQYDCCNLLMASERGGQVVPRVYDRLEDGLRFLRRWVFGRAVPRRKKLPVGVRNTTPEEERLTALGHAILEGPDATLRLLRHEVPFTWCNPTSPLQYKASEAQSLIDVARSPHGWNSISPEVMLGGTGPVTMAGALVQHNAEVLAGVALSQFARAGSPCLYGCVSAPMDLRNAEISHGNFETALFNAAIAQLADRYGLPSRLSPGNTSDRKPSARALAETAVGLYLGAAAGGNIITTGLLDSTIMISYEHLILVDELIGQVRSVAQGVNTDANSLALEAIVRVGGAGGNYFDCDHTLTNMKRDVYYSDFTGRIARSYEDVYAKAHARVEAILARREAADKVDQETLARLELVENRLREDDQTWRTGQGDWWASYFRGL